LIPKLIHYCWFGGKPLGRLEQRCLQSWKKYFPDCTITEWNEQNYNVNAVPYTKEAYLKGKYAFVSDYARLDILYKYGGIYFDVDVEVIKSFDPVIKNGSFMGTEENGRINAGLGCGFKKENGLLGEILDYYSTIHYTNPDGTCSSCTIVDTVTLFFKKKGFVDDNCIQVISGVTIYPPEYFNPVDFDTHLKKITANTFSIHYGSASWVEKPQKITALIHIWLCRILGKSAGRKVSSWIRKTGKSIWLHQGKS
jgi:mannosyltransferase OCH1-like enzyme